MKHFPSTKILLLLIFMNCRSNTQYYRAIQSSSAVELRGYYVGRTSDVVFTTKVFFEISENSSQIRVFNQIKGASFEIWTEACKPESKSYNFGTRIFLYQCPNNRVFRTSEGIFAHIERKGEIPFEPRGTSLVKLEKIPQEQFASLLEAQKSRVADTATWYKEDSFYIEVWSFEEKYRKHEKAIAQKLAEIKAQHNYEFAKTTLTTDQLLDLEQEISFEIHGFVNDNFR